MIDEREQEQYDRYREVIKDFENRIKKLAENNEEDTRRKHLFEPPKSMFYVPNYELRPETTTITITVPHRLQIKYKSQYEIFKHNKENNENK
jgi:hypothetical protein